MVEICASGVGACVRGSGAPVGSRVGLPAGVGTFGGGRAWAEKREDGWYYRERGWDAIGGDEGRTWDRETRVTAVGAQDWENQALGRPCSGTSVYAYAALPATGTYAHTTGCWPRRPVWGAPARWSEASVRPVRGYKAPTPPAPFKVKRGQKHR